MDGQMVLSDFGIGKKQPSLEEILAEDECNGCEYTDMIFNCNYPDTPNDYCICGDKWKAKVKFREEK